jgi:hypothetical protein
MNGNDCGNDANSNLLGSNVRKTNQEPSLSSEIYSRTVLMQIKALRELLSGKGNEYTKTEVTRLLRELTLIANLITIQNGGKICLEEL